MTWSQMVGKNEKLDTPKQKKKKKHERKNNS